MSKNQKYVQNQGSDKNYNKKTCPTIKTVIFTAKFITSIPLWKK